MSDHTQTSAQVVDPTRPGRRGLSTAVAVVALMVAEAVLIQLVFGGPWPWELGKLVHGFVQMNTWPECRQAVCPN